VEVLRVEPTPPSNPRGGRFPEKGTVMKRELKIGFIAIVVAIALCLAGSTHADEERGWRIRVDFALVDPGGDTWRSGGGTVLAELDTGVGIGVRGEYQLSRRFGIEFGLLSAATVDTTLISGGATSVDIASFAPLSFGADFHLTPDRRVDLYVGPQVALIEYGDVEVTSGAVNSFSIDRDFGVGAIVGLDVPVGEARHWAFQTNLRHLVTSMESGAIAVDFDPTIFSLGFGYRW